MDNNSNIVLIGMPGAGKSTVGIILAKMTSRDFIDTDILIQLSTGRSLQEIVDTEGPLALRKIEEEVILTLRGRHHVIATGGSAVYSACSDGLPAAKRDHRLSRCGPVCPYVENS